MHITLPALLLALTSLSTVSALPAKPTAEKKYPYFAMIDFFDKPTCSNIEQGKSLPIPDQGCIKIKPRSMFMYIGWSETFSHLSLYSDDNCAKEVKVFEQGPDQAYDSCTNLKGVGTVLSMKNTSRKRVE